MSKLYACNEPLVNRSFAIESDEPLVRGQLLLYRNATPYEHYERAAVVLCEAPTSSFTVLDGFQLYPYYEYEHLTNGVGTLCRYPGLTDYRRDQGIAQFAFHFTYWAVDSWSSYDPKSLRYMIDSRATAFDRAKKELTEQFTQRFITRAEAAING